jgi:hypothetical protein
VNETGYNVDNGRNQCSITSHINLTFLCDICWVQSTREGDAARCSLDPQTRWAVPPLTGREDYTTKDKQALRRKALAGGFDSRPRRFEPGGLVLVLAESEDKMPMPACLARVKSLSNIEGTLAVVRPRTSKLFYFFHTESSFNSTCTTTLQIPTTCTWLQVRL